MSGFSSSSVSSSASLLSNMQDLNQYGSNGVNSLSSCQPRLLSAPLRPLPTVSAPSTRHQQLANRDEDEDDDEHNDFQPSRVTGEVTASVIARRERRKSCKKEKKKRSGGGSRKVSSYEGGGEEGEYDDEDEEDDEKVDCCKENNEFTDHLHHGEVEEDPICWKPKRGSSFKAHQEMAEKVLKQQEGKKGQ